MESDWRGAIRRGAASLALASAVVTLAPAVQAAEDPEVGDLRDLRVGSEVKALPERGYTDFRCGPGAGEVARELAGWADFHQCPPDAAGLHEVAFAYDEAANPWPQ
jgi:hypothetical protein